MPFDFPVGSWVGTLNFLIYIYLLEIRDVRFVPYSTDIRILFVKTAEGITSFQCIYAVCRPCILKFVHKCDINDIEHVCT